MVTGIKENILHYYQKIIDDRNHRYCSWEHCYSCFQTIRVTKNQENLQLATLHLAFFLASWGMYRPSAELLQKDYRVHSRIVEELLREKYLQLWDLDFDTIEKEGPEVGLTIQLAKQLKLIYADLKLRPTDTLVTKVLLGTLGCIPAYDILFRTGVTFWNQELCKNLKSRFPARLGIASYYGLINFYREYKLELKEAQSFIAKDGKSYPIMKLADMYFWNLGLQKAKERKSIRAAFVG